MRGSKSEFLLLFGWDDFFAKQFVTDDSTAWLPARVISEERNLYQVQYGISDTVWASISGKMQYNAKIRADYPAVGDWVLIEIRDNTTKGIIHQIGPRKSTIYRKQIGSSSDAQILSTNVDYVFITTSINEDLNHRRLERYLAIAWDSSTSPIILLTKSDLKADDIAEIKTSVQIGFPNVPVYTLSKNDFDSADYLPKYLEKGKTSVFVGSSGVGKSTLVNYLIGEEKIKTQIVRESDGKGRHTTTSRNLYISRFGGLIIDTPGMRELSLSDHAEGVEAQFDDIMIIAKGCRFSDCKHHSEPGCALKAALADGSLLPERWKSYQKLEAEVRHGIHKQDKALASEEKKNWKKKSVAAGNRGLFKKGSR